MQKYLLYIFFLLLNFAFAHISYGQIYHFKHYNIKNGFPQSNADCVFQDKDGYMWFATQKGAVKFDGFKYTIINQKDGLNSNIVNNIFQDTKERYWISTNDGLSMIKNNVYSSFTFEDGLYSNSILNTIETREGKILICTTKGANYITNNKVYKLNSAFGVRQFLVRQNNEIWAITQKGIYQLIDTIFKEIKPSFPELKQSFNFITEDKNQNIWLASNNGIYKLTDDTLILYTEKDGLIHNRIATLLIDSENNLWYGSETKGCGKFENNNFINFTAENGMTNTSVLSLYEDIEKNIWIGGRNGASVFNKNIPFVHYNKISLQNDEIVMGMICDKDKNLWFCTYGRGLTRFDGEDFFYLNEDDGTIDNSFFDIEITKDGVFWFASANNGIIKYDGKKFTKITEVDGITLKRILTIFQDSKGNLWFGTNGQGVIKYDGKSFSRFGHRTGLFAKNIMGIHEDFEHNLWFGSVREGFFKYDGKNITNYNEKNGNKTNYIRCFATINNIMWVGTATAGICRIEQNNSEIKYHYIDEESGLNSNNVYILYSDSKDNLWVGTEKGVSKLNFDKENNLISIKNYSKKEGFFGIETNTNGVFEDEFGNIWFGTIDGATKYIPELDKKNQVENKTYITNIQLFFEEVNWKLYSDSLNNNLLPVNLELSHKQNHLTFSFTGLCFSNPEKVRYKYRLLGQNNKWTPIISDNKADFSNITPGKYEFQVISCNNDGTWNKEPVSYHFTILKPFWQTWWFVFIVSFTSILLIYTIISYRIKTLKKAKKVLEQKVVLRTAEISQQKEEIQTQADNLKESNSLLIEKNEEITQQNEEIHQQNEEIKTHKQKIEETHKHITDSINYAKRIQTAILPTNKLFKENFSEYFIFFRPRDVVSGDFYWAKKVRNQIIFAVADCTGHGVPGAFMSMLEISFLNEVTRKKETTSPAKALELLRKYTKTALKQIGDKNENKDGMDIALCIIDLKTNVMEYAGAYNSAYIIRNEELNNKELLINNQKFQNTKNIITLKADRQPIGIYIKEKPYINHKFQLQKNDTIYLSSDGYADQFGGKDGYKFYLKQFKELLLSFQVKNMKEQGQILEQTFVKWKGKNKQLDDVLVVGVKIKKLNIEC